MDRTTAIHTRLVRLCCLSGLLGSTLFLTGDMLFYGTLSSGAGFHPYVEMAQRPSMQLVIGGALGPSAAILSAVGMGVFYLTLQSASRSLAGTTAILLAVMMLIGGSYHAVYTVFGFAAKIADHTVRDQLITAVTSLRDTISYPMYAAGTAGTALAFALGLWKRSQFPRWLLILLPTTLSQVGSVLHSYLLLLPAPIGGMIRGGWINGSFVLFFGVATVVFWRARARDITQSAGRAS
jgi:hypothetical protein